MTRFRRKGSLETANGLGIARDRWKVIPDLLTCEYPSTEGGADGDGGGDGTRGDVERQLELR